MPRKSKVLESPHVNQILDWIDENKSSRWISRELENQFNESIGHVAISNFRKKNITDEAIEIVDTQLKNESKEKQEEEKQEKLSEVIQNKAERDTKAEAQTGGLIDATAKQYRGVLNVADNFEDDYYALKNAAKDENSKVTQKDVVDISFKAVKLAQEIRDGSSMEDTITEGFGELANAIQKSREILKES